MEKKSSKIIRKEIPSFNSKEEERAYWDKEAERHRGLRAIYFWLGETPKTDKE